MVAVKQQQIRFATANIRVIVNILLYLSFAILENHRNIEFIQQEENYSNIQLQIQKTIFPSLKISPTKLPIMKPFNRKLYGRINL